MVRLAGLLAFVAVAGAWARPASADGARAVRGPYLTGLSSIPQRGVDVRIELDASGPVSVDVRLAAVAAVAGAPRRFADAKPATMHVVHLTGLQPDADYTYDVRAGDASVGGGRFTAPPAPNSPASLTFLVYGDDRTDPDAHANVVRAMLAIPSDFLVNTGDIVADGGSAVDWQSFFDTEKPLIQDRPILLAIGNHELFDDAAGANFARYFGFSDATGPTSAPKAYGTTRVGETRFFFLNGMDDWSGGEDRQWLQAELAKADKEKDLRWRIAVVHHGPASSGPHGPNKKLLDAQVPELLLAHKVDLVVAGHDHIYDRGDLGGLKYVVSGGGGAPLYPIEHSSASSLKAESVYHFVEVSVGTEAIRTVVHRADGSLLEKCALARGAPWSCAAGTPATVLSAAVASQSAIAPLAQSSPAPATQGKCSCSLPGARAGRAALDGTSAALPRRGQGLGTAWAWRALALVLAGRGLVWLRRSRRS